MSSSITPPFSDLSWVSNGLYPGTDISLESTGYDTIVTGGIPCLIGASLPSPNSSEKLVTLQNAVTSSTLQNSPLGDLTSLATIRDVNGSIVVPSPLTYIQLGSGHSVSFDPSTLQGRITPALSNQILNEFDTLLDGGEQSFTGSDLRIMIEVPLPNVIGNSASRYAKQLLETTTITVSTYRAKAPVSAAGYIGAKGFARGRRTIAGTIILTQFTVEVLLRFLQSTLMTDKSKDTHYMKVDQLPAFNMTLLFSNESGYASFRRLLGVEFVNDGTTYSINDMFTEQTISYMATDMTPLIPLTLTSLYNPVDPLDRQTRRERSGSDLNNVPRIRKTT